MLLRITRAMQHIAHIVLVFSVWDHGTMPLDTLARAYLEARTAAGWTQAELAARAGVARATVARIERGEGGLTVATLQRVAAELGQRLEVRLVEGE